jgi:hypothetical protein
MRVSPQPDLAITTKLENSLVQVVCIYFLLAQSLQSIKRELFKMSIVTETKLQ